MANQSQSSGDLSGKLIIKARLGDDIRRIPIYNEELTYDELILMMQRVFRGKLKTNEDLTIKYADEDGDLITIFDDSDMNLAIQLSRILKLTIFTQDLPQSSDNQVSSVQGIRGELIMIRDKVNQILDKLVDSPSVNSNESTTAPPKESTENASGEVIATNAFQPAPAITSYEPAFDPLTPQKAIMQNNMALKPERATSPVESLNSVSSATQLRQQPQQQQQPQQLRQQQQPQQQQQQHVSNHYPPPSQDFQQPSQPPSADAINQSFGISTTQPNQPPNSYQRTQTNQPPAQNSPNPFGAPPTSYGQPGINPQVPPSNSSPSPNYRQPQFNSFDQQKLPNQYGGNPQAPPNPGMNQPMPQGPGTPNMGPGQGNPQMPPGPGNPQMTPGMGNPQMPPGQGNRQMPPAGGTPQMALPQGGSHMPPRPGNPQMPSGMGNPQMPPGPGNPQMGQGNPQMPPGGYGQSYSNQPGGAPRPSGYAAPPGGQPRRMFSGGSYRPRQPAGVGYQ